MSYLRRLIARDPLWVIGAMWPLVLLAPLVPGLPAPAVKGLPWRQELVLSILLALTAALLLLKSRGNASRVFGPGRVDFPKLMPLALFFLWSGASLLWSRAA